MAFNPYKKELYHPLWFDKMKAIFQRDGNKCCNCSFPIDDKRRHRFWDKKERKLVIHFRIYLFDMKQNKYMDPWKYADKFMKTYCTWCKEKGDRKFEIPIKKIF